MKVSVGRIKEFMKDHSIVHIFIIDKVTVPSFDVLDPNVLVCSMGYRGNLIINQPKFEEHLYEVMGEFFDNENNPSIFTVDTYDNLYIFKDYKVEDLTDYASDLYVVGKNLYDIWAEKFFTECESEVLIDEIKNGEYDYEDYEEAVEYVANL